jgi:hypothetical protein
MRSTLTTTSIRVALAVLTVAGDLGIQRLDSSPRIEPSAEVLFVILSVLAGVIIARWWAVIVAFAWLAIAATIPPGPEDAGGALIAIVGAEIGLAQALLIGVGVAAVKLLGRIRRGCRG